MTKNCKICKITFSKLYGLSPLGCIGKSLAVKGKTGTENIKDGALPKRTIFSFSLTAVSFSDEFGASKDNLKEKNRKKLQKIFSKVKETLHL